VVINYVPTYTLREEHLREEEVGMVRLMLWTGLRGWGCLCLSVLYIAAGVTQRERGL
jgi:hypothetical protein